MPEPRSSATVGVIAPSFNTVVEPELEAMRPPGVSHYVTHIEMPDTALTNDAEQEEVVRSFGPDLYGSLSRVMTANPDVVVFGISIPTFWNGLEGMRSLRTAVTAAAGVPVVLGADAVLDALSAFGGRPRLGVITPYQPIADAKVRAFLEEAGYPVVAVRSLVPSRSSLIASVQPQSIAEALEVVAAAGAEVLVQVGTNLPVASVLRSGGLVDLRLPLVAVNTASYRMALRTVGVVAAGQHEDSDLGGRRPIDPHRATARILAENAGRRSRR